MTDTTSTHHDHHSGLTGLSVIWSRDFAYADRAPVALLPFMPEERADINAISARDFAELLSGPLVDIYVGPDKRHWCLHRNLLCHHSTYFETEFEGHEVPKTMKADGQKLELPDDDPIGFELLVKWLYQGQLENSLEGTDEQKYEHAVACYKLYLLCDKFDMIKLKNLAMDLYRQGLHEAQLVPDADEINEIYRRAPVGSPFRRLMTNISARQIMDNGARKDAESYRKCFVDNPDFAVDMINAIRSMSGGMLFEDPTRASEACQYHDHGDGSSCSANKLVNAQRPVQANEMPNAAGTCYLSAIVANAPSLHSTVSRSPAVKSHFPIELSAEKRTPRKLDIRQSGSPTPKASKQGLSLPRTNGPVSDVTPAENGASPQRSKAAVVAAAQPAIEANKRVSSHNVLGKRRAPHVSGDNLAQGERKTIIAVKMPLIDATEWFDQEAFSDITIRFGTNERKCHKLILCGPSDYFKDLLGPGKHFAEAQQPTVELKDDEPMAVEAMLRWLYTFDYEMARPADYTPTHDFHLSVVVVADKYLLNGLRDEALRRLSDMLQTISAEQLVNFFRNFKWSDDYPQEVLDLADNIWRLRLHSLLDNEGFHSVLKGDIEFAMCVIEQLQDEVKKDTGAGLVEKRWTRCECKCQSLGEKLKPGETYTCSRARCKRSIPASSPLHKQVWVKPS
ncbi:hypothetical protein KC360_g1524 [Hortaea werneckii]|nr:hypothetical protein KC325_g3775 [Hortaea werneckii]KAI6998002.1 hypothetical protein KC359_g2585 [Hortaea werneckii]KAI7146294.1 hypothetical protein KC344_g3741 [Hortaea werneckii]KAI7178424.1 hypothetical protein KC360_g1524 [Hortaea werneckii]